MAQRAVKSQNTDSHMAFTKGRIEWLIPKTLPIAEPIIQRALNLSLNSLEELERNLIYKTSDRMHLVLFDNFAEYQQYYQRKYRLSSKNSHINLFIGPEGGFTQEEIDLTTQNNFQTFNLGQLILRAETACIVASSHILI
jgi:RsmE family RNA methyltransferase